MAYNERACWDGRFAYQYWWGDGKWIDAEYVAVTEIPRDALDTIADPDRPKRWITETLWVWTDDRTGYSEWTPEQLERLAVVEAALGEHRHWGRFAVGWPRRALECEWRQNLPADGTLRGLKFMLSGATVEGGHVVDGRWIRPTRIRWAGAIYNSTVFAAGWGAALALMSAAAIGAKRGRRVWRLRRGKCPACAYDLRSDFTQGCPECGWRRTPSGL